LFAALEPIPQPWISLSPTESSLVVSNSNPSRLNSLSQDVLKALKSFWEFFFDFWIHPGSPTTQFEDSVEHGCEAMIDIRGLSFVDGKIALVIDFKALRRNLTKCPFHAAFLKATNSVLVAAMR
jgi:hypothetical protein